MDAQLSAYIRSWMACITALTIIAVLIDYILPNSRIRRYVQYGVGLLVLRHLLDPAILLIRWLFT